MSCVVDSHVLLYLGHSLRVMSYVGFYFPERMNALLFDFVTNNTCRNYESVNINRDVFMNSLRFKTTKDFIWYDFCYPMCKATELY